MWTAWLLLTLNGMFFTLRMAGTTGAFPRALKREEEQVLLEKMAQGDQDARNQLIEHNLRLVAHIIKKGYPSRKLFLEDCGTENGCAYEGRGLMPRSLLYAGCTCSCESAPRGGLAFFMREKRCEKQEIDMAFYPK